MPALIARRVLARISRVGLRSYAAEPASRRKGVTVINDDGRVSWGDLRPMEKVARTTQQTFNFGLILVGLVMTVSNLCVLFLAFADDFQQGGVGYFLWGSVFSPDSKTSHFNRAVDELRASPRVRELIGPAKKINAYGDGGWNRWVRNAPIRSTITKDGNGREHMLLEFNIEGPNGRGRVHAHLMKATASSPYQYKKLSLDVPGQATVYLYNDESPKSKGKGFKFLGFNWNNESK
jgi:mitochondrial import inner membrane translocase subunit TIM21